MMKIHSTLIFLLLCLSVSCANPSQPGATAGEIAGAQSTDVLDANTPTAEPSRLDGTATPGALTETQSSSEALLVKIPKCQGITTLEQPVKFEWPNIEKHLEELKDSSWGYYACEEAPASVVALYRKEMKKPPYNMIETNWIDREEGFLGLYFHSGYSSWFYLWVVPQSAAAAASFVILAETEESLFTPGECYLDRPGKKARLHVRFLSQAHLFPGETCLS